MIRTRMRIVVLFSGGKDSCYTVWLLQHQGWEITKVVTVKPQSSDSWTFHYPNIEWTRLQARAMDLAHELIRVGKNEMADLEHALSAIKSKEGIEGLATGAVASEYQRTRFDQVCDRIGLRSFNPLWHKRPEVIIEDLVEGGFKVIMTGVAAAGLDQSWLGREMSAENWKGLGQLSRQFGIHLSGEGGEYETFVVDAPHFRESVHVEESSTTYDGQSGYWTIERASLRNKLAN